MCDMPYMARNKLSVCASHLPLPLKPVFFHVKQAFKPKISVFIRRFYIHVNHLCRSDPVDTYLSSSYRLDRELTSCRQSKKNTLPKVTANIIDDEFEIPQNATE
jgi:hypothetical protein